MKAIRIHFTDNGDELRVEEVPQPDPKANEVLIKAKAIGVNRADLGRRRTVAQGADLTLYGLRQIYGINNQCPLPSPYTEA